MITMHFERNIYMSSINDTYTLMTKILSAVYHVYITDIKPCFNKYEYNYNSQFNHDIIETFMSLSHCIKTEYNFNKNEYTGTEHFITLSDTYDIDKWLELLNTGILQLSDDISININIINDIEMNVKQSSKYKQYKYTANRIFSKLKLLTISYK